MHNVSFQSSANQTKPARKEGRIWRTSMNECKVCCSPATDSFRRVSSRTDGLINADHSTRHLIFYVTIMTICTARVEGCTFNKRDSELLGHDEVWRPTNLAQKMHLPLSLSWETNHLHFRAQLPFAHTFEDITIIKIMNLQVEKKHSQIILFRNSFVVGHAFALIEQRMSVQLDCLRWFGRKERGCPERDLERNEIWYWKVKWSERDD